MVLEITQKSSVWMKTVTHTCATEIVPMHDDVGMDILDTMKNAMMVMI